MGVVWASHSWRATVRGNWVVWVSRADWPSAFLFGLSREGTAHWKQGLCTPIKPSAIGPAHFCLPWIGTVWWEVNYWNTCKSLSFLFWKWRPLEDPSRLFCRPEEPSLSELLSSCLFRTFPCFRSSWCRLLRLRINRLVVFDSALIPRTWQNL